MLVSRDPKLIDPNMDDWHTPCKIGIPKKHASKLQLLFFFPPTKVEPKNLGSTPNEEFRILVELHSGKLW